MKKVMALVVPCYNEEEVLYDTTKKLSILLNKLIKDKIISKKSFILYVDDGSYDNTWNIIKELNLVNKYVSGLSLNRNRGHQIALLAGMEKARDNSDFVISIDADLQDDISVIPEMIEKYYDGCDIVYGVRNSRGNDSFFKKYTSLGFYKLMFLMGTNIIYNHADFRLMSKRSLMELGRYKECNLFLRGIVSQIGFKSDFVYYKRLDREAGVTKYPLKKMISFAIDGITSFSISPIRIILFIGFFIVFLSIIFMGYSFARFFGGATINGWASLFCSIWFLGGVQLLSIGIIGEYIGKTYIEVKNRPRYCVLEFLDVKRDD